MALMRHRGHRLLLPVRFLRVGERTGVDSSRLSSDCPAAPTQGDGYRLAVARFGAGLDRSRRGKRVDGLRAVGSGARTAHRRVGPGHSGLDRVHRIRDSDFPSYLCGGRSSRTGCLTCA